MPDDDVVKPVKRSRSREPAPEPEEPFSGSTPEKSGSERKYSRGTLAMILKHTSSREDKNDALLKEVLQKNLEDSARAKRQMWIVVVLLVLGLLSSVGVASAIKYGGTEMSFGEGAKRSEPKD